MTILNQSKKLYYGEEEIDKVYAGVQQAWPATPVWVGSTLWQAGSSRLSGEAVSYIKEDLALLGA